MPRLRSRTILELGRGLKALLRFEGVLTRGELSDPALEDSRAQLERQSRMIEERDQEISRLKRELSSGSARKPHTDGIQSENLIWVFGHGRTGSTWLGRMMRDMRGYAMWMEPSIGELFGNLYYLKARSAQRASGNFVLGDRQRKNWLRSIRSFTLQGARGRFPRLGKEGLLVIKEPHGSIGAPLMMEALPESRMIFLIRDPRDTVASSMDAFKKGNWAYELTRQDDIQEVRLATDQPEAFVKLKAESYLQQMVKVKEAYDSHAGYKTLVRYEDLVADVFGTMRRVYSELGLLIDDEELASVVEKHSFDNVPEEQRGEGKFYRKGTSGGWREDLTAEQAAIVERVTAPILEEFYSG